LTGKGDKQSMAYKILIYAYGNPGRQDDGLGNALLEKLEHWVEKEKLNGFEFDSNYQLNIEDAEAIHDKDLVIFLDASTENIDDFEWSPVDASTEVAFTSHAASPGYIVGLCREIYNTIPPTYLLHIKGYTWEFKEGLSAKAVENMELAFTSIRAKLKNPGQLIESFRDFK